MTNTSNGVLLGSWVRRFLLEHLVDERNLSINTQRSYRDTLRLLLPFVAERAGRSVDRLTVEELSSEHVRAFLQSVEVERGCAIATRNQRLAAIHSLANFVGLHSPEHIPWCGEIRTIPFKKAPRSLVTYLDKAEMDSLLKAAAENPTPQQALRDHALLVFLYNTGARADEAAHVLIRDLRFGTTVGRDPSSVVIRGKGNKLRQCPLWDQTVNELAALTKGRSPDAHAFLNRCGQPMTRFGVYSAVTRNASKAAKRTSSLMSKRVSPHTIRHTTAMHLLQSGVDINTIRAWLGHVSLATTNVYAEADLEMKAKALANCEITTGDPVPSWRADSDLMKFLQAL